MLINLSETLSIINKVKHIEAPINLESFKLDGIEYEIASKTPLDVTLTNTGEKKVLIEGHAKLSLIIPCSRCLEEVTVPIEINYEKEIDFNETEDDRTRELDETNYISGYNLDVDVLVYDEIFIGFPTKVLCQEDCQGICNVCGMNLNNGTCDCESTSLDPRMSAIRDIFKNSK